MSKILTPSKAILTNLVSLSLLFLSLSISMAHASSPKGSEASADDDDFGQTYINKFVNWAVSYPSCWDFDRRSSGHPLSTRVGLTNENCLKSAGEENGAVGEKSIVMRPYIEKTGSKRKTYKNWARKYRTKLGYKVEKRNGTFMIRSASINKASKKTAGSVTWMYALMCNKLRVDILLTEKLAIDEFGESLSQGAEDLKQLAQAGPSDELDDVLDSFTCIRKKFDFAKLSTIVLSE